MTINQLNLIQEMLYNFDSFTLEIKDYTIIKDNNYMMLQKWNDDTMKSDTLIEIDMTEDEKPYYITVFMDDLSRVLLEIESDIIPF